MITGDDWFTKTMLTSALSRSEKPKSQSEGTASTGNSNPFAAVLTQLLMQMELQSTDPTSISSYLPNMEVDSTGMDLTSPLNQLGNMDGYNTASNSGLGSLNAASMNIGVDPTGMDLTSSLSQLGNMGADNTASSPGLGSLNAASMNSVNLPLNNTEPLHFQIRNVDTINQALDGKLKGMGEAFVRAGQQYNIDPALLAAIAQHETGNGRSSAALEKNNIAGMMGINGLKSYASVEDSIMDMARNLSKNYLATGLSSISKIGAKYAPIGAGNDPAGLNNYWVSGVTKYFDQLMV